jgi:sensor histidine kinase YesM
MHPIFSQARNLLAVAALWLTLSGLISYCLHLVLAVEPPIALILYSPLIFIYFFFCLSNYYVCLELPLGETPFLRLISTQLIAVATTVMIWLLCGYFYMSLLNQISADDWLPLYRKSAAILGITGAILYCFWILAHYVYLMAQQHDAIQRAALQEKLLLSQTELQAVKATVHPHFLYNSLNTVANLALVEPGKVHNICLQISEFLRYSVSYSRKSTATVGEEVDHIQNYLGIERERFSTRLQTDFDIDETVRSEPILPLLLFPLVENSIKHGIDSLLEGGTLNIRINRTGDTLHIHIANPYDALGKKQNGTHIGLDSVRKRIQAHYGGQARVEINRNPDTFTVDLYLPQQQALQ